MERMHWHRMYLLVCVGREGGQGTHLPHTGAFCIDNSVNDISTNFFIQVVTILYFSSAIVIVMSDLHF